MNSPWILLASIAVLSAAVMLLTEASSLESTGPGREAAEQHADRVSCWTAMNTVEPDVNEAEHLCDRQTLAEVDFAQNTNSYMFINESFFSLLDALKCGQQLNRFRVN
jgi:hypothetical protein